ncbi:MAG TPA: hypothetical protein VJ986_02140 [Gaiellaceae bacterium]|nr:hypothetical protein [Gaiellaceae bacterium]
MELQITPEPSEEERAAIVAALAEEAEERRPSPRADAALPRREQELES